MRDQASELREELLQAEGSKRQLAQQMEALREELDGCQASRDALRAELRQFESQATSLYSDVSSWKVERTRLQGGPGAAACEIPFGNRQLTEAIGVLPVALLWNAFRLLHACMDRKGPPLLSMKG